MPETLIHPPRTAMEVFKILPEGTLAEVINGQLYMSPSPIGKHQKVISQLMIRMGSFIEENRLGEFFVAPLDVLLGEDVVQPDLIFVSSTNASIVNMEGSIKGAPDMLIEVLSPGSIHLDTIAKKSLYERAGVKEYWIIDPTSCVTTGYILVDGKYSLWKEEIGLVRSKILNKAFSF